MKDTREELASCAPSRVKRSGPGSDRQDHDAVVSGDRAHDPLRDHPSRIVDRSAINVDRELGHPELRLPVICSPRSKGWTGVQRSAFGKRVESASRRAISGMQHVSERVIEHWGKSGYRRVHGLGPEGFGRNLAADMAWDFVETSPRDRRPQGGSRGHFLVERTPP